MELKINTPRTDLYYDQLLIKMGSFSEGLAKELGVEQYLSDDQLRTYARLCTRVAWGNGEVDFEIALPSDTPEAIRVKFDSYLDSACKGVTDRAIAELRAMDLPNDPITAPTEPTQKN